jgi:hypothetical protein
MVDRKDTVIWDITWKQWWGILYLTVTTFTVWVFGHSTERLKVKQFEFTVGLLQHLQRELWRWQMAVPFHLGTETDMEASVLMLFVAQRTNNP